jgi:hypothetical protein
MIQICISAKAEDVEAVRQSARTLSVFKEVKDILIIPLSPTGKLPITHYFCAFNYYEKIYNELMNIQKLSDVEIGSPRQFLKIRKLRVVKNVNIKKFPNPRGTTSNNPVC